MSLFNGCHHDEIVRGYDQVDVGGYSVVFTNEPIIDSNYTIVETNDFEMLKNHLDVLHQ